MSAVPTAACAGTPSRRISRGVVSEPAPTPVSPIATAIMNPSATAMTLLVGLYVDSAFELAALPAPRTRIVRIEWQGSARLAPNTGVALFVQREDRNPAAGQVGPDLAGRPVRQRADLAQRLATRKLEIVD